MEDAAAGAVAGAAQAQVARQFPPNALRGDLIVTTAPEVEAWLDGQSVTEIDEVFTSQMTNLAYSRVTNNIVTP